MAKLNKTNTRCTDPELPPGLIGRQEDWTEFEARIVARLPSGVQPVKQEEWVEFRGRVLGMLRPAFHPKNQKEWAEFEDTSFSQMLIQPWLDDIYVSQEPEQWKKFEKRVSPKFRPLTLEDLEMEYTTLRFQFQPELNSPIVVWDKPGPPEDYEVHRVRSEKRIAWRLYGQELAARIKRRENAKRRADSAPESRPDLLHAVYVEKEWKDHETKWREKIKPHLPAALRPASERDWMRLDCQVLSQMPLQPRTNYAMQLNTEWQTKEEEWEEWEKLIALKLLSRYALQVEECEEELDPVLAESEHYEFGRKWSKISEWEKRLFAQLPYHFRPAHRDDWIGLDIRVMARWYMQARTDQSDSHLDPEWKIEEDEWEDWEKILAWKNIARDEECEAAREARTAAILGNRPKAAKVRGK